VTPTTSVEASGFTSIASGFSSQGHVADAAKVKRSIDVAANRLQARAAQRDSTKQKGSWNEKDSTKQKVYPYEVDCGKLVEVVSTSTVTKTASKVQTVTASSPTTSVVSKRLKSHDTQAAC
jgi:hypothetical protein